jgi:hypothetical protein
MTETYHLRKTLLFFSIRIFVRLPPLPDDWRNIAYVNNQMVLSVNALFQQLRFKSAAVMERK